MYSLKLVLYCCSLRSQRGAVLVNSVCAVQNQKQLWIRFAHRTFYSLTLDSALNTILSLRSVNTFKYNYQVVIREKAGRNFNTVQSLVDTRSVNLICVFYCAFLVELMHQRKHRQKHKAFTSLRLKTMTVQARFARPSWTSGFLVLQGLDALDHRFLLPFTFHYRSKLQRTSCSRPVRLLRS